MMTSPTKELHDRDKNENEINKQDNSGEVYGRYPDGEIWYDMRIASCYQGGKMRCDFGFEFAGFLERERMGPVLVTLAPLAKLVVIVLFLQTAALFATGHSSTQL